MAILINPYTAGDPVGKTPYFVGREDVLREVVRILRSPSQNAITLYGQRRIGKTSVLQYLEAHLPAWDKYHPVFFDLMNQSDLSLDKIVSNLARAIALRLNLHDPALGDHPADTFRSEFLPAALKSLLSDTKLVLLLDEFDVLADPKDEQEIKTSFFRYLRDLRQMDVQRLKFVFTLGRNMEDLDVVARGLFKDLPAYRVSLLSRKETDVLVRLSERERSLAWSTEAVDAIWELTSGHPYLTQALCYQIWEDAFEQGREGKPVDAATVQNAVSAAMQRSQNMFTWLWEGFGPAERIAAAALASAGRGVVDEDRLAQILAESGVRILIGELRDAPQKLKEWDILAPADGGYLFRVELLRRWIAENKPLSRTWDELDRINPVADNLYNAARGLYLAGNLEGAIAPLNQALDTNPNHQGAMELLGEILLTRGELDQAQNLLERLQQLNPARARHRLKQMYIKQADAENQLEGKLTWLEKAQAMIPNDRTILEALQNLYRQFGERYEKEDNLPAALEAYIKADDHTKVEEIRSRIHEREVNQALSELTDLKQKRAYQEAYQRAQTFREAYPNDYDWQAELNWLEQARLLDDKYKQSLGALEQGDRTTAKRLLAEVIAFDPDYEQASRYLYLAVTGENPQALKQARKKTKQKPTQKQEPLPTTGEKPDGKPRRLSKWNPLDALRLLWWIGFNPIALNAHVEEYGEDSLTALGNRLLYTLVFLPLVITIVLTVSTGIIGQNNTDTGITLLSADVIIALLWLWLLLLAEHKWAEVLGGFIAFCLVVGIALEVAIGMASGIVVNVAFVIAILVAIGIIESVASKDTVVVASGMAGAVVGGAAVGAAGGGGLETGLAVMAVFVVISFLDTFERALWIITGFVVPLLIGGSAGWISGRWIADSWMKSVGSILLGGVVFSVEFVVFAMSSLDMKDKAENKESRPWTLVLLALSWLALIFFSIGGLAWLQTGVWPAFHWPF